MDLFDNVKFKELVHRFCIVVDEINSNSSVLCLRSNFNKDEDVLYFMDMFSSATNTNWIVYSSLSSPTRMMFHKHWKCHHSTYNKKKNSEKNLGCDAFIDITIKKVTKCTVKRDRYLKQKPPLPGLIKIGFNHSHATNSVDLLQKLRVSNEVKQEFRNYFLAGIGPTEAMHLHQSILLARGETYESLLNTSINPKLHVVNHIHKTWQEGRDGTPKDSFALVSENKKHYADIGAYVHPVFDTPWAILVVTPLMKKVQDLPSAKETIFIDSISLCPRTGAQFTVMSAAMKVGTIPIAVILHESQKKESYKAAFLLLKRNFPLCFGKEKAPLIFVTNDDAEQKSALSEVWLACKLCSYHSDIARAQWKYLWSEVASTEDRPKLLKLFLNVMYADTQEKFKDSMVELCAQESEHPEFIRHFKQLLRRKYEWALIYRSIVFTKNKEINDYAEVTVRILRDVVLSRTNNFDIVTLIEFCILVLDKYLVKKLLNYAYNASDKPELLYSCLCKRTNSKLQIKSCNYDDNYLVQCDKELNVYFVVNTSIGMCSCVNGSTGAFCKHQFILFNDKKINLPKAPVLTPADRYDFAILAVGDECALSYFLSAKEETNKNDGIENMKITNVESLHDPASSVSSETEFPSQVTDEDIKAFMNEVQRVFSLCRDKTSHISVKRLTKALKEIKTESEATSALCIMSLTLSAKMRAKRFKALRRYRMPKQVCFRNNISNRTFLPHTVSNRSLYSNEILNRSLYSDEIHNKTFPDAETLNRTVPAQPVRVVARKQVLKQFARKRVMTPDILSMSEENSMEDSSSS